MGHPGAVSPKSLFRDSLRIKIRRFSTAAFFQRGYENLLKDKKTAVRLILFLLALIIAVGAFTMAVVRFLHRDSGYYDIEYTNEGNAMLYGSGIHLKYYAQGGSGEIRETVNLAQKAFTDSLLYIFRLLDGETVYEGVTNLASLNRNPGVWLEIPEALEKALRHALEATGKQAGYSLFSGAIRKEWETLRYLDEPQNKDPLNDPEEQALLSQMASYVQSPEVFSLEIQEGKARLTVSGEYAAWARENEIGAPVLDLNLMKDAYLLDYVARAMTLRGLTQGYLYSDSGLSVFLNGSGEMAYALYGYDQGTPVEAGQATLPSPSAFCQFSAAPLTGETYGYYVVEQDGKTVYRHPWYDARTGDTANPWMTAAVGGQSERLTDLAFQLISFICNQKEANLPKDIFSVCTRQDAPKTLYCPAPWQERMQMNSEAGFSLEILP